MYNRPRIIPCLLVKNGQLVKTTRFNKPDYLGDPINAVKIFNEKEVDELCILDITPYRDGKIINIDLLKKIATQAFMPLSYGGGVDSVEKASNLFRIGFEKIVFNTSLFLRPEIVKEVSDIAGSQSVVASLDVKKSFTGRENCYIKCGKRKIRITPEEAMKKAIELGVGEFLINSINNDGTMKGYDTELIKRLSKVSNLPLIACGGAGNLRDIKQVLTCGAHAAAAGSLFVYHGLEKAVLINYPTEEMFIKEGIFEG